MLQITSDMHRANSECWRAATSLASRHLALSKAFPEKSAIYTCDASSSHGWDVLAFAFSWLSIELTSACWGPLALPAFQISCSPTVQTSYRTMGAPSGAPSRIEGTGIFRAFDPVYKYHCEPALTATSQTLTVYTATKKKANLLLPCLQESYSNVRV